MEAPLIVSGLRGEARRVVTADNTAEALGSGDVPVFGTPAVLAVIEEAAVDAIRKHLPEGGTSVGIWVELEHLAPSKIGAEVVATALLAAVEGRLLHFDCEAHEGERLVAKAKHRRYLVVRDRWLARA
ncbi:MAG TPA: hotdog domain-containing protein [Actinomycetota bacterium]|nr:hotdog domain-containing protein [Actinomycetota bacterium]